MSSYVFFFKPEQKKTKTNKKHFLISLDSFEIPSNIYKILWTHDE